MSAETFPATVARVLDEYRIIINRGASSEVSLGDRFLVYQLSEEEIIDPETNESLGKLEIVKGTGRVVHVQQSMATIESDRESSAGGRTIRKKTLGGPFSVLANYGQEIIEEQGQPESLPFEDPRIGDKAKRV